MVTKSFTVRITKIGKQDATYPERENWIGRYGKFEFSDLQGELPWLTGWFTPEPLFEGESTMMFFQVQLKAI